MRKQVLIFGAIILGLTRCLWAGDLRVPQKAVVNTAVAVGTQGEGSGTLYLIGPALCFKHAVRLGETVQLTPEDVRTAGVYTAILRSDGNVVSRSFVVSPGPVERMSFLAQPSRVPANARDVITGTVFVLDRRDNLVLAPVPVDFTLTAEDSPIIHRTVDAHEGVAWTRMDSSRRSGNAQFTATSGEASVKRIVQQVAAEPCNLRFHARPAKAAILVETDPVRDCAGNAVPDGMIVTFTDLDPLGKSTVDAVVKKGIAQALLPAARRATISVAAGVVVGNEIHWEGGQ
jgi:hypothetical protein